MGSNSPRLSVSVGIPSGRSTGEAARPSEDMYVGYAEKTRSTYIRAHLRGDALGYRFKTFMDKAVHIQEQDRQVGELEEKSSRRVMVSRLRKLQRGWLWRVWYSIADGALAVVHAAKRVLPHPTR